MGIRFRTMEKEVHVAEVKAFNTKSGNTRFVLSSSGHIAGIVNPPSSKARHWRSDENPPDPEVWLAGATEHAGSWWDDWVGWAKAHGGQRRKPPPMGSDSYPPIADAPGSYIHEK